jgi:TetR/AcrR family transcriptional regulator, cholesterol catabolism regulator
MAKITSATKASKKEIIVLKAAQLFCTKGFNATNMRELAVALGVEAPSLYNHIGGKNELLEAICFKVADQFNNQLTQVESGNHIASKKIEAIIRFHIQMMLVNFEEVYVANRDWKHLPQPFLNDFLQQRRTYQKKLALLVEAGIKNKELKNINPHVVVLTILSAVRGLEFWQRHKKNISAATVENDMVAHLLNGLVKQK